MFQNVSLIPYRILHHEFDLFFSDTPMNKNVAVMTCKHRDKMLQVNVPVLLQWHVQTADVQWSVLPSRCALPPRLWWYTLNPDMSRQTQEVKNSSRETKKLPRNKSKSVAFLFLFRQHFGVSVKWFHPWRATLFPKNNLQTAQRLITCSLLWRMDW